MTEPRLRKRFTPTESLIAQGIRAGLSYAEIGLELARAKGGNRPVSPHTIRSHVNRMAGKIDGCEDLAPRHAVYSALQFAEWEANARTKAAV